MKAKIRNLEKLEMEALLKANTLSLTGWGTVEETKKLLLGGMIDYAHMERNIEKITLIETISIIMGHEVLDPKGLTDNAGKQLPDGLPITHGPFSPGRSQLFQ